MRKRCLKPNAEQSQSAASATSAYGSSGITDAGGTERFGITFDLLSFVSRLR
jgi:hypothetical protein